MEYELDGVTNYSLRRLMLDFIMGYKDGAQTHQDIMNLYENYPLQHFYSAVNMTGSQDVPQLLAELASDLPGHMSAEEQAWIKFNRLQLFMLWQMTFPGAPCVYYGDGTGLEGSIDPQDYGAFPPGQENERICEIFHTLIALRNHYDVLRSGAWEALYAEGSAYAYLRVIENGRDPFGQEKLDNVALILLNRDREQDAVFNLDLGHRGGASFVNPLEHYREVTLQENLLQITVPPLQGRLLLRDRWSANKDLQRSCGILLHPTSLPSPGGIGDLGAEAYRFVDFLAESAQSYWQVLPLNPPAAGNSPYQCFSAFAGNPLLIDLQNLVDEGLLRQAELDKLPRMPGDTVDFASVKVQKDKMLLRAFTRFSEHDAAYKDFCMQHDSWLGEFALFMALKKYFGGRPWNEWEQGAASRQDKILARYCELLSAEISYIKFQQFIFFRQWLELKEYARKCNVKIIGDIPLFVAHDSSDVWCRPHLFALDEQGSPLVVAGVPPDYFCETGQLWGNPLYRWEVMKGEQYRWWKERLQVLTQLVDLVRIDHFRGLEAYWEIPAGDKTAENGRWVKGPGEDLFNSLREEMGTLPLVAEDLGLITPEVKELKRRVGIPGMKVLQFMVEPHMGSSLKLPLYERNTVVYTGTHDNDTLLGWCGSSGTNKGQEGMETVAQNKKSVELCRHFIEMVLHSDAYMVIIPIQDILFLNSDARMNIPGTAEGNWHWRLQGGELTDELARELRELTEKYYRGS